MKMKYRSHYDSPLGGITLGSDGKALTGLWFDGQVQRAEIPVGAVTAIIGTPVFAYMLIKRGREYDG